MPKVSNLICDEAPPYNAKANNLDIIKPKKTCSFSYYLRFLLCSGPQIVEIVNTKTANNEGRLYYVFLNISIRSILGLVGLVKVAIEYSERSNSDKRHNDKRRRKCEC